MNLVYIINKSISKNIFKLINLKRKGLFLFKSVFSVNYLLYLTYPQFYPQRKNKKNKYNIILKTLSPFFSHKKNSIITTIQSVHNNREFFLNFSFIKINEDIYTFVNKELKFL